MLKELQGKDGEGIGGEGVLRVRGMRRKRAKSLNHNNASISAGPATKNELELELKTVE